MQQWHNRGSLCLAQGETGTNSRRASQFVKGVYPTHLERGQACYVWDWEGQRYIDFIGGLGSIILGYNHPKVTEAVTAQLQTGYVTGSLPSTLEVEVAELIQRLFPVERVRFLKNGDDATTGAVRIARALEYIRDVK